ncbi:outer membrane efflux protein [mine drainage metagenome]|uniref:Outer membrane efflux protein n=1 Tax=mine drainage metagenome TaxID=410659 RepID=A0A1J5TDB3_9ZZZZ
MCWKLNINTMKKEITITLMIFFNAIFADAQKLSLENIFSEIQQQHPAMKMFDADIMSMDEAAKGAKSWMPTEFASGFYQTPYNVNKWKADMGQPGMGMFMISAQQMIPNKQKQETEAKYMNAMSSVEKEKKKTVLNDLFAEAKKNYYEWIIIEKKISIIQQNQKILNMMLENAEIRYKNGMEKLSAYYKAKAALGNLQNMKIMLDNDAVQKKIALNTLMNRDKSTNFEIDTTDYSIKNYSSLKIDSSTFTTNRSDLKAIDRDINLTYLKQDAERAKLKPEFGIRYDHMFAWAQQPWQFSIMGMLRIPLTNASQKMYKANMESLKWKAISLSQQKEMILNEATGMAYSIVKDIEVKKKQLKLYEENIIPALQKNFKTTELGYQQNTEELFMLYDAWETLNMTQLEYTDQLGQLLLMQTELEKVLEKK